MNYYEFVARVAREIVDHRTSVIETELESKIVLGLYLRLAYEKFIITKSSTVLDESCRNACRGNVKKILGELQNQNALTEEESERLLRTKTSPLHTPI